MNDTSEVFNTLLMLATAFIGGHGLKVILEGRNSRAEARRQAKSKIIQEAKLLIQMLDSSAYSLIGDFRQDIRFISISKYLSDELVNKISDLIMCRDLPDEADSITTEAQVALYERIIFELKEEVINLETKWINNSIRK